MRRREGEEEGRGVKKKRHWRREERKRRGEGEEEGL